MAQPANSPVSDRFLGEDERTAIADRLVAGRSLRAIAAELGRNPSTISREIRRNSDPDTGICQPHRAQRRATVRRGRPKQRKLAGNTVLWAHVQRSLRKRWSPEQISRTLPAAFPDRPEMRVSPETIYQSLYLQGRGALRREVAVALRTGRACRRPRRRADQRRPRFVEPMVMISERAAEADDRAVPGHWEGDLIMGAANRSAIGTLVERTSRDVMLLHLPNGHAAEHVREALVATIGTLPASMARSLTWDQGVEMGRHAEFQIAARVPVHSATPVAPGSAAATRSPTACWDSTSRKGPICGSTRPITSEPSRQN